MNKLEFEETIATVRYANAYLSNMRIKIDHVPITYIKQEDKLVKQPFRENHYGWLPFQGGTMEYTVKDLKVGSFNDNYGNVYCTVSFEGVGEPVTWALKDPSKVKVGDKVFGTIEDKINSKGNTYKKFKKQTQEHTYHKTEKPDVDWDRKDAYIRMQWAYRESLAHFDRINKEVPIGEVRNLAKSLMKLVDEDVEEYMNGRKPTE